MSVCTCLGLCYYIKTFVWMFLQNDLIVADLDGGFVSYPEGCPLFPEPLVQQVVELVSAALSPNLSSAGNLQYKS